MPVRRSALLALLLAGPGVAACSDDPPPHLFLITSDTLRADHLSMNGYPRATSPEIDAFAELAWNFTDAVTTIPKTCPTFATLFTGLHPQEHGVRYNFTQLPPDVTVLAERLKASGYRTAAFVGNPALRREKGFARGFDVFMKENESQALNDLFERYLDEPWDQPTFVWIHYLDPHGPYDPSPEYEALFLDDEAAQDDTRVSLDFRAHMVEGGHQNKVLGAVPKSQQLGDGEDRVARFVARYDAEIRQMDTAFGEVLGMLRARGLYDPSVVIFTSDHGESLGEHDFYFEHGWFAYEATLHVPLLIKEPGQTEGRRVEEQVSALDFLPTVVELLRLPVPARRLSGTSLLSSERSARTVVIENSDNYPEKYLGVRGDGLKYLVRARDGEEELYELLADPDETRNLLEERPEEAARLRRVLERDLERLRGGAVAPPGEGVPDSPEVLQGLHDIGYGQGGGTDDG